MDLSLFFAQLFGLYFIVAGISIFAKQESVKKMVHGLAEHPYELYFAGFCVFLFGIILVLLHNVWDGTWHVIITVIAWLTLLKGAAYILLPQKTLSKWLMMWGNKAWFSTGALIALVVGLYLAYLGFLA